MNPADRRARRSRRLLQDAFRQLLREQSFDAISVQNITERADVNRGTFYAHFPDKYALLEEVVRETFQEALLARVPVDAPFTPQSLEQLIIAALEYLGAFVDRCRPSDRSLAPLVYTSMRRELGRRLLAWLATPEHAGHPDVPPEVAATAMSWMIFGSGLDWTQGPQTDPAQARATQLVRLLTSGLTTGLATGNQPLAATDERAPALLV